MLFLPMGEIGAHELETKVPQFLSLLSKNEGKLRSVLLNQTEYEVALCAVEAGLVEIRNPDTRHQTFVLKEAGQ